ncbi:MEDS domain-containing protein [Spirillospora sp. NPDC050679]
MPYTSQTLLLHTAQCFVREGLEHDDVVVMVAAEEMLGRLRDLLEDAASARVRSGRARPGTASLDPARLSHAPLEWTWPDKVYLVSAAAWYTHPVRVLAALHDLVTDASAGGRRLRLWGELPWSRWSTPQSRQWMRYEALLNVALADTGTVICCPADVGRLPEPVVEAVYATHPRLAWSARRNNPRYQEPERFLEQLNRTRLPVPPADAFRVEFDVQGLGGVRQAVAATARSAGLPADRVPQAVLAVTELATNAVVHSGRPGRLHAWSSAGELIYQIGNPGRAAVPSACGLLPPDLMSTGGRGLWLAQQLTDVLEVGVCDGGGGGDGGTVVRVRFLLPPVLEPPRPDDRPV